MPDAAGHVLVVDDDAAVRNSLKFLLELEGLRVRTYEGGAQLLAEAELPLTGCMVIDYHMPGMDGFTLLRRLRDRHVELPAILITARVTEGLRERVTASGFRTMVLKPFNDSGLVDSIRSVLAVPIDASRVPGYG